MRVDEILYEGPAHDAAFYVPSAGIVRSGFNDPRAGGYVRARDGALFRVPPETRLFLMAGHHVLTLYDPKLIARVLVVFQTD